MLDHLIDFGGSSSNERINTYLEILQTDILSFTMQSWVVIQLKVQCGTGSALTYGKLVYKQTKPNAFSNSEQVSGSRTQNNHVDRSTSRKREIRSPAASASIIEGSRNALLELTHIYNVIHYRVHTIITNRVVAQAEDAESYEAFILPLLVSPKAGIWSKNGLSKDTSAATTRESASSLTQRKFIVSDEHI